MSASPSEVSRLLGQRLGELRRARGWSQSLTAEKLGMTPRNYQALELGEGNPTVRRLGRVAGLFDVEIGALFAPAKRTERRLGRPRKRRTKPMEGAVDQPSDAELERVANEIADESVSGYEKILSRDAVAEIRRTIIADLLATDAGREQLRRCLAAPPDRSGDPSRNGSE